MTAADGVWASRGLVGYGLSLGATLVTASGLLAVAAATGSERLGFATGLYLVIVAIAVLVAGTSWAPWFGAAATTSVGVLGMLSFGPAILPGLAVWSVACAAARRNINAAGKWVALLAGAGAGSASMWVAVLL